MLTARSPLVVAVTVTFNAGDDWEPFLACVTAQRGIDWHLLVIDNFSYDETCDRLRTIADSRITVILNDANLGVAAANNQGIAVALERGADHILILNNDTEFADDLFAGLAGSLDANAADAVSPLIPYYDRPDAVWFGGGRFTRALGILNVHDHDGAPLSAVPAKPFAIDYAPTCCLHVRREVFERIGTMDEEYFVYWDDTDFCWRMHTAGLRIVLDPGLRLLHKVSRSTGGNLSDFTIRYAQRNQMMFVRKHFGAFWLVYTALASVALGGYFWMVGRTNLRMFGLRLKALREGLTMPVTRHGDRMELEVQ
jgi:GT2 family glycosyltransferase